MILPQQILMMMTSVDSKLFTYYVLEVLKQFARILNEEILSKLVR